MAAFQTPDLLVLAGGGIVGEAWMHGVLAGIEDGAGIDLRDVEGLVGTSAGSIVAARLVSGRRPPRPREAVIAAPDEPDTGSGPLGSLLRGAARLSFAATAPLAAATVAVSHPLGAKARAGVLARAAHGRPLALLRERVARWNVAFDGRLRVCAVDRRSGRRVVFGTEPAPRAAVADAVCASCAIPWVFAPIRIGDREYVDGGAWSITNLDVAPVGRGSRVLCLDPVAGLGGEDRRLLALRSAFRAASALELAQVRRRGARVLHVWPGRGAAAAMGPNLMAPERGAGALAAGYAQGLALTGAAAPAG